MPTRHTRKTCKHCKKKFTPARIDQIYCSQACGQSARRSEQDKDKVLLSKLYNTGFFSYLHYQSKRAGTVEVVPKKLEDLSELHAIWSYNNKANAYCKEREYEISHIHPVCGVKGKIGTLHPSNLVVQPATFNRSHGAKHLGNGHSISKYRLKQEWLVTDGMKKETIIELIFKRIGIPTLKQFNKECKPTTLAIIKELEWFKKHICLLDDSIVLDQLDLDQLRKLRADLTDKKVFNLDFTAYDQWTVILAELRRLGSHRADAAELSKWLASLSDHDSGYVSPFNSEEQARFEAYSHIRKAFPDTFQSVLAGASVDLAALVREHDYLYHSALQSIVAKREQQRVDCAAFLATLGQPRSMEVASWVEDPDTLPF